MAHGPEGAPVILEANLEHLSAMPDPAKPVTLDSLVEQYREAAVANCRRRGLDEAWWRAVAETWAYMDLDIIQAAAIVGGISPEEAMRRMVEAMPADGSGVG